MFPTRMTPTSHSIYVYRYPPHIYICVYIHAHLQDLQLYSLSRTSARLSLHIICLYRTHLTPILDQKDGICMYFPSKIGSKTTSRHVCCYSCILFCSCITQDSFICLGKDLFHTHLYSQDLISDSSCASNIAAF